MNFHLLTVAYPFAPVGPDATGGAEQVASLLDRAMVARGVRSTVIACGGSHVAGTLVTPAAAPGRVTAKIRQAVYRKTRQAIESVCQRERVDIIHYHGIDFHHYLRPGLGPALVSLHLPLAWYPQEVLTYGPGAPFFHCVSSSQRLTAPDTARFLPDIENGVELDHFRPRRHKRKFTVALGRICPEKGFHLALAAARQAGWPCLLAGRVFGYDAHERYFREGIVPQLDGKRRFIGEVGLRSKRRLLAAARCLLIPSLAAETSSLVAMEALACGTPVIAFRAGALAELIEPGRTGFLVDNVAEMAQAIGAVGAIDPQRCRAAAEQRFSAATMVAGYLRTYRSLLDGSAKSTRFAEKGGGRLVA